MELLKKNGIVIFWLLLFADCFFVYQQNYQYHSYLKPALIPILLLYTFLNARKNHYLVSKSLVFMGLIFSWLGDLLLLNEGTNFFIWGMTAFFITQIFYIIFLFMFYPLKIFKATEAIIAAIILGFIAYQLNKFIGPELKQLPYVKFVLIVFAIGISIMAMMATNIFSSKSKRTLAVNFFMTGAALLIFSFIVLVINKFKYLDENYLQVITLMSYGYGQCLLVQGFGKRLKG